MTESLPEKQRQRKHKTKVYKLVVVGLYKSGKSQFIDCISQYTEWQSEPGQSWYFGRVRVDESHILHFMEPPIQRQFDFLWLRDILSRMRATGFIVLVDSTKPKFFGEFLSILYTLRGYHPDTPIVVAANKQDHPRAWAPEDIQLGLGINDVLVLPCSAHQRDSVRDVVVELLYQIMDR